MASGFTSRISYSSSSEGMNGDLLGWEGAGLLFSSSSEEVQAKEDFIGWDVGMNGIHFASLDVESEDMLVIRHLVLMVATKEYVW